MIRSFDQASTHAATDVLCPRIIDDRAASLNQAPSRARPFLVCDSLPEQHWCCSFRLVSLRPLAAPGCTPSDADRERIR
jgi:hypothetical protein